MRKSAKPGKAGIMPGTGFAMETVGAIVSRSAVKEIERILERSQAKPSPTGKEDQDIWTLPLREGKEKP